MTAERAEKYRKAASVIRECGLSIGGPGDELGGPLCMIQALGEVGSTLDDMDTIYEMVGPDGVTYFSDSLRDTPELTATEQAAQAFERAAEIEAAQPWALSTLWLTSHGLLYL